MLHKRHNTRNDCVPYRGVTTENHVTASSNKNHTLKVQIKTHYDFPVIHVIQNESIDN